MDKLELMNEYNHWERRCEYASHAQVVVSDGLIKHVVDAQQGSYIAYYSLNEQTADACIKQQINYFSERARNFEWKTYSTDAPANIGSLLLQNGFTKGDQEHFMALALDSATVESISPSVEVIEVTQAAGIRDAINVQEQVWGGDLSWQYQQLLSQKQQDADSVLIYVVYEQEKPVASAWITFNEQSPFAGIWGGSTIAEYRAKGYYTALLKQRMKDAQQRAKKYLIIDASLMSRPIVARYGFEEIATTTAYDFSC